MASVTYPATDLPTNLLRRSRRKRIMILVAGLIGVILIGVVLVATMGFTCG